METVKVTIIAENPNHTHAGKPVAKGDEIEVTALRPNCCCVRS